MANSTTPWKLSRDVDKPALSPEQIDALAEQFDLSRESLSAFSKSLSGVLDPLVYPMGAGWTPRALKKGMSEFQLAVSEISRANKLLTRATGRLAKLDLVEEDEGAESTQAGNYLVKRLTALSKKIRTHFDILESFRETGMTAYQADYDRRRLKDERRSMVCRCIFDFWLESGRNVSFTTDATNEERTGPLVKFTNAVVGYVTDPSTVLSGETIRTEIEDYHNPLIRKARRQVYRSPKKM